MAKKGKIYFVDKDFTDAEVAELFGYPCIFILKDNTGKLLKQTAYDLEGTKSMVEFKDSGSIKNYPTFADFPIPGDITTIYKALDTDEIYIWDAEMGTYLLSSIDDSWKNYVELSIGGLQTSIDGINEELVTIETRLDDLDDNDNSLQDQITAEKNRNDSQDSAIVDLNVHQIVITTTSSITTNTLGAIVSGGTANVSQRGRNVLVKNGVSAINFVCKLDTPDGFVASYQKMGSGNIAFVAETGTTPAVTLNLIDDTSVMTGAAKKQTASLSKDGSEYSIQISNR